MRKALDGHDTWHLPELQPPRHEFEDTGCVGAGVAARGARCRPDLNKEEGVSAMPAKKMVTTIRLCFRWQAA